MKNEKHETEWCLLQNQFESYEKHSLYIKLLSIFVLFLSEMTKIDSVSCIFILAVLWLQDSIWKTFQSRLEPRLLDIEKYMREGPDAAGFQFNSEYQKLESKGMAKIKEYAVQAIRPTVAFPHVILVLAVLFQWLYLR